MGSVAPHFILQWWEVPKSTSSTLSVYQPGTGKVAVISVAIPLTWLSMDFWEANLCKIFLQTDSVLAKQLRFGSELLKGGTKDHLIWIQTSKMSLKHWKTKTCWVWRVKNPGVSFRHWLHFFYFFFFIFSSPVLNIEEHIDLVFSGLNFSALLYAASQSQNMRTWAQMQSSEQLETSASVQMSQLVFWRVFWGDFLGVQREKKSKS